MQGFVLDLRQNPGGLLDQAVAVSSLFLDRGVVVSLVGRHEPHEVFRAIGGTATRLPVVVLVDRYSASSSEIVAAALRDHHRATVVGERTFGKALVQSIDPLDNGAALELTIARDYTPSGEDISNVGVAPQIHGCGRPADAVRRRARDRAPRSGTTGELATVARWPSTGDKNDRAAPCGTRGDLRRRARRSPT